MALFSPRVPLAWLNLTHHWPRLAVKLAGVGFAVVLMFMEWGFRNALLDSTVALLEVLRADLVLTRDGFYSVSALEPIDRRRMAQLQTIEGVASVEPIYLETARSSIKHAELGFDRPIRAVGVDPDGEVFTDETIQRNLVRLKEADTVLFDARSKEATYGSWKVQPDHPAFTELSGRQARVLDTFSLGTDFVNDGTVIASSETFCRALRPAASLRESLSRADFLLIQLERPGEPPPDAERVEEIRARINHMLAPDHLEALTLAEFIRRERDFWASSTPIGYFFLMGMVVGFIVGTVICYQILFTDLSDHEAEFATLKAMGYPGRYFFRVVGEQSLLLAVLGFLPGLAVSYAFYSGISSLTGLPMRLSGERALAVLGLTVVMCVLSGMFALRKLFTSDPASLFK